MLNNEVPEGTCDNLQQQQHHEQQQQQQQQQQQVDINETKQQFLHVKKSLEDALHRNERNVLIVRKCMNELNRQWGTLHRQVCDKPRTAEKDEDYVITEEDEEEEDEGDDDIDPACLWLTLLEEEYHDLNDKTIAYLKTISDESNHETELALQYLDKIEHYNTSDAAGSSGGCSLPRRPTSRRLTNIFRCVSDLEHSTYCANRECPKMRCSKFKTIGLDTQHSVFRQYILLCFFHAKHCRRPVHSVCTLCKQFKGVCRRTTITATVWNRGEPRTTTTTRGSKYCTKASCMVPYCKEFREKISLHETAGLENMLPIEIIENEFG